MNDHETLGWLRGFELRLLEQKVDALAAAAKSEGGRAKLRAVAAEKIHLGANLTRAEAAAYLDVSPKTLQRMDTAGQLRRCPGLAGVVRYAARDVLRLASAHGKEA